MDFNDHLSNTNGPLPIPFIKQQYQNLSTVTLYIYTTIPREIIKPRMANIFLLPVPPSRPATGEASEVHIERKALSPRPRRAHCYSRIMFGATYVMPDTV